MPACLPAEAPGPGPAKAGAPALPEVLRPGLARAAGRRAREQNPGRAAPRRIRQPRGESAGAGCAARARKKRRARPDARRGPGNLKWHPARPIVARRPAARGQHSGLIGRCEPAERHLERASCEWSQSIMRRAAVSSYVISVFLDACGPRDREIGVLSLPSYRISLRGAQARRSGQTS